MDGIGWFTYEVFSRLAKKYPEHEFHFIFDRAWLDKFIFADNVVPHKVGPQARHPLLFYWWFERSLPQLINKIKPDLFVSPDGFIPLTLDCKVLNVLHDINFHHNPDDFGWFVKNYYNHFVPQFARKADRLATVSNFCKRDITEAYQLNADKIDVVYNGVNENYAVLNDTVKNETRNEFTRGCPYVLFLGTIVPRKNLKNLLLGFDEYKSKHDDEYKLLVVGSKKYWTPTLEQVYVNMKHKGDVIFLGYRTPEELTRITGSASLLAFVSLFEGFGIPILEAMKCGVPVITSNQTATKEVADQAALLIDPNEPSAIADGLGRVLQNSDLSSSLIEKGLARAAQFSWDKTADDLWNSMMKTLA